MTVIGFTMAEILLSLTIIGVVAAITLPALIGNINERVWNTQRKALYTRMSQALALMPHLNGYGTYLPGTADTGTETFIANGLSKVLKINNICDNQNLADCGAPTKVIKMNGSKVTLPNTWGSYAPYYWGVDVWPYAKTAAFETENGESMLVYYNPLCSSNTSISTSTSERAALSVCANFIYDLNGNKGPNRFGKDIGFITALYPTDPVVIAPMPLVSVAGGTAISNEVAGMCKAQDSESRVPGLDELTALTFNYKLTGYNRCWSTVPVPGNIYDAVWIQDGGMRSPDKTAPLSASWADVCCMKR